jgi:hypothetical protein
MALLSSLQTLTLNKKQPLQKQKKQNKRGKLRK